MRLFFILLFVSINMVSAQNNTTGCFPGKKIAEIVNAVTDNRSIHGAVVCVSKGNETEVYSAGNMTTDKPYFIASVTKLYTASIILKLSDNGNLKLDDPISGYLPAEMLKGLHVYKGVDYSNQITIRQLLSNTSGIADYFEQKQSNGISLMDELISGKDRKLDLAQILDISKNMKPKFAPGKKGKAFYSDTNFQLLGKIIETITGMSISEAYEKFIFRPLHLQNTYLYRNAEDTIPAVFYYRQQIVTIPEMMASFTSDGGIVSTAGENMIFLKAFFSGQLFSPNNFDGMKHWNRIYMPFKYGMGLARFKFIGTCELLGHPGATGAFAYYCPAKDAFITGTINQVDKPGMAYNKLILRILQRM